MIAFGITDKGKVRSINQDTFNLHIDPDKDRAVLTLCDGMGGEKAGEIASSMACSRFMSHALDMPGLLVHHQLPEFTQTHVH